MSVYDLAGRTALVTGGARGLGAGMAEALARAGAAVAIGDIREDLGKETAEQLRQSGASAQFVPLDVTEDPSWEEAVAQTVRDLGGLDILINNAGVEISGLLIDIDAADMRRMSAVNVLGTWHVLLAAEAAGATRVIHFSSAQALGIAEGERPPPRLTTQRGDGANPRGTAKTTTASTSVKLPTTRRSRRCSMPSVRTCEFRRLDLP